MSLKSVLFQTCQVLFFPQDCVLCGSLVINEHASPLCPTCLASLWEASSAGCDVCGLPLPGLQAGPLRCGLCSTRPPAFDAARAWGDYRGGLRRVIRAYKFGRRWRLARPLGELLLECSRRLDVGLEPDWIVPIPLHRRRRRQRGFDQALLLARVLSDELGVALFPGLERVRATPPQSGLGRARREANIRGAFRLRRAAELARRDLLVVDDVMTTGATVGEACRLLRSGGKVRRIAVLTLARVSRPTV